MSSCMALVLTDSGSSITIPASAGSSDSACFYDDPPIDTTASRAALAELLGKLRQRLEQIGNEAVIRDLKDRRLLVLVDGDDHLGVLHAGEMLDGTGDADRDIELGRHDLAGLAHLPIVGRIAGIDRRAGGADRRAELVGNRLDVFGEILAALHGAAARDHD